MENIYFFIVRKMELKKKKIFFPRNFFSLPLFSPKFYRLPRFVSCFSAPTPFPFIGSHFYIQHFFFSLFFYLLSPLVFIYFSLPLSRRQFYSLLFFRLFCFTLSSFTRGNFPPSFYYYSPHIYVSQFFFLLFHFIFHFFCSSSSLFFQFFSHPTCLPMFLNKTHCQK